MSQAQFFQKLEKFIKSTVQVAVSSVQPAHSENENIRKLVKAMTRLRRVVLTQPSKVTKTSSKSPMHNKRNAFRVRLKRKQPTYETN